MNNMRRGFTMIELIFVIVIIGILAAVAIPKLAATRDDAKISAEMASIRQVIDNLGAEYTSQAQIQATSVAAANSSTACFGIAAANATGLVDGNISVTTTPSEPAKCPANIKTPVYELAVKNGIIPATTADTATYYEFGGQTVVR